LGRPLIKAAIDAVTQADDLAEHTLDSAIVTFLKHKGGNAGAPESRCRGSELVRVLLTSIADKDQGRDLAALTFALGMFEHPADLRFSGAAHHFFHEPSQHCLLTHPLRRPAFGYAAVVDELPPEPADCRRGPKHVRLQLTGCVPCRLPRCSGIDGEDQPTVLGRSGLNLVEESIDRVR